MTDRIIVICSHCASKLTLKSVASLGKRIRCPKCSEPFIANATAEDSKSSPDPKRSQRLDDLEDYADDLEDYEDDSELDELETMRSAPKRKGKRGSRKGPNRTPIIIGAGILVVLIAAGVVILNRPRAIAVTEPPPISAPPATDATVASKPNDHIGGLGAAFSSIKKVDSVGPATTPPRAPGISTGGTTVITTAPDWASSRSTEPFDLRAYFATAPSTADNAADDYRKVLASVNDETKYPCPPAELRTRTEAAQKLERVIDLAADVEKLKSGAVTLAHVEEVLTLAEPVILQWTELQKKPACQFYYDFDFNSPLPPVSSIRSIGRLMQLELFFAWSKSDFDRAHRVIARVLRLARDLRPRGIAITQLTAIATQSMLLDGLKDFTLVQPGITATHCDQLLRLLQEHEQLGLDPLQEALKVEYLTTRKTLDGLRSNRVTVQQLLTSIGEKRLKPFPVASIQWDGELSGLDQLTATLLDYSTKSYNQIPSNMSEQEISKLQKHDAKVTAACLLIGLKPIIVGAYNGKARLASTSAIVAVRRYQLSNGKLPSTLSEALTSAGISRPIIDPYSGKPISYTVLDGKPVVYSIGSDLKDDGGKIEAKGVGVAGDIIVSLPQ